MAKRKTSKSVSAIEETLSLLARRASLPRVHAQLSSTADEQLDWYAYLALYWIATAGPLRLSALAEHFGVVSSTVCRHVQQLERRGLINKETDTTDRRANLLSPTARGKAVLDSLRNSRTERVAEALTQWSAADLDTLAGLLERLTSDLEVWGTKGQGGQSGPVTDLRTRANAAA
jgi:DNA-binding MarR family transcriptional regulator